MKAIRYEIIDSNVVRVMNVADVSSEHYPEAALEDLREHRANDQYESCNVAQVTVFHDEASKEQIVDALRALADRIEARGALTPGGSEEL